MSGDAAVPRSGVLACLLLPALALPPAGPRELELAGAGVLIVLGLWLWLRRVRAEIRAAEGLPFLVPWRPAPAIVGAEPDGPGAPAGAGGQRPGQPLSALPSPGASPGPTPRITSVRALPTAEPRAIPIAGGVHAFPVSRASGETAPPAAPPAAAGARPGRAPGAPALRLERGGAAASAQPADATLQLLPGRLEVVGGGRPDIRFVRRPGPATELTLGRLPGPPDRHIRLAAATVSRLHARLRYEDGRWTILNLSRTNPVRVNGQVLADAADPRLLVDGDRVEVGEFLLVFRER